jgi:hypothetical protein
MSTIVVVCWNWPVQIASQQTPGTRKAFNTEGALAGGQLVGGGSEIIGSTPVGNSWKANCFVGES